jgi:hypothetical protein
MYIKLTYKKTDPMNSLEKIKIKNWSCTTIISL